jgi:Flp pilus assembly protein TadD
MQEALDRGDSEGAARLAERALTSGLEHPALLCVRSMALQAAGRLEEAVPFLQRAVALMPTDPSIMNALARCLLGLERLKEALAILETALPLEPRYAETHANIGYALHRLGRLADADRSYLRALELQPDHVSARVGKAALCIHYGDHEDAHGHARLVLDSAPDCDQALVVLALAEVAQGSPAAAEARLRRLMQASRPHPLLASYLGDALHAQGRTEEAFEAWSVSGAEVRRAEAPRLGGEGVLAAAEGAAGVLERLSIGAWPKVRPGGARRPGPGTHVFLLGFARSGTSLLGLALDGHEDVELLEEQEPMIDALRRYGGAEGLRRLVAANEPELEAFRQAYWRRARGAGARLERRVFVDKQPFNSLNLPVIARLFPEAKVLVARRDPRDVVLSCFRRRFLMNRYTYELLGLEGAARLYAAAMRILARTAELASPDALATRHEDLVQDFEGEMGRVCAFLGLAWSDAIGAFAGRVRSSAVATPSASQLAQGLNSSGVGQWRRYARQLSPLTPVLEPWVRRFGYEPSRAPL